MIITETRVIEIPGSQSDDEEDESSTSNDDEDSSDVDGDDDGSSFPLPLFFEHSTELPKRDVDASLIQSVTLERVDLRLLDATSVQDFSFVETLRVYVRAADEEQILVAQGGPFAIGTQEISLELFDAELRPYVVGEDAEVYAQFIGYEPEEDLEIQIVADFLVDIHLRNAIF